MAGTVSQIDMSSLQAALSNLKLSIEESFSKKIEELSAPFLSKIDSIESKFNSVRLTVQKVMAENKVLHTEVQILKIKINQAQQANLGCNIIIKGVKEVDATPIDKFNLGLSCVQRVDDTLQTSDIVDVRRIGKKIDGKHRPILIQFRHAAIRDSVLAMKKKMNIKAMDIIWNHEPLDTGDEKIYMDEHLTKENSNFFMLARKLKLKGAKYVWVKHGRVLVRFSSDENSKVENVWSAKDIDILDKKLANHQASKRRASSSPINGNQLGSIGVGDESINEEEDFMDIDKPGNSKQPQLLHKKNPQRATSKEVNQNKRGRRK